MFPYVLKIKIKKIKKNLCTSSKYDLLFFVLPYINDFVNFMVFKYIFFCMTASFVWEVSSIKLGYLLCSDQIHFWISSISDCFRYEDNHIELQQPVYVWKWCVTRCVSLRKNSFYVAHLIWLEGFFHPVLNFFLIFFFPSSLNLTCLLWFISTWQQSFSFCFLHIYFKAAYSSFTKSLVSINKGGPDRQLSSSIFSLVFL